MLVLAVVWYGLEVVGGVGVGDIKVGFSFVGESVGSVGGVGCAVGCLVCCCWGSCVFGKVCARININNIPLVQFFKWVLFIYHVVYKLEEQ